MAGRRFRPVFRGLGRVEGAIRADPTSAHGRQDSTRGAGRRTIAYQRIPFRVRGKKAARGADAGRPIL
jgi:hypothetical protein